MPKFSLTKPFDFSAKKTNFAPEIRRIITFTMNRFKRLGIALIALLASATAFGAFNCLTINRVDGQTDRFAIDSSTTVGLVAGGVKLAGKAVTVIYPIREVDSYTFENYTFTNGKYEGDKPDVASISEAAAAGPVSFAVSGGVLTVSGATPGTVLTLFGINGSEVSSAKASDDGNAALRFGTDGVYLLNVNGVAIKVIL